MKYFSKFYVKLIENRPSIYKVSVAEPAEDEFVFRSYEQIYPRNFMPVFYPLGSPLSKGLVLDKGGMFDSLSELKKWVVREIWSYK